MHGSDIFYLTLLFIFVTAIVTAMVTKWARDKCLKFFHGYHVTLERSRGHTIWGTLKVFSSGIEVAYDHPFVDLHHRKKNSFIIYQDELDQMLLGIFRYHDEMTPEDQRSRKQLIHRTINPGPTRRMWRKVRSLVNTLRDAFTAAISAVVGQYQKMNPASSLLASQGSNVSVVGTTLLDKFANAYEPILEQYIGRPVILDVADPIDPNNQTVEYTGFLADYTQKFVALFNVEHPTSESVDIQLPDVESGPRLPPLPAPASPNTLSPDLPPPLSVQKNIAVRLDGLRLQLQNTRPDPVVVRRLERTGFQPVLFGTVIPPNGFFDIPARDARAGKLHIELVRCVDVLAPRKLATIRHAGELVHPRGFIDELRLDQLPLIPTLLERNALTTPPEPVAPHGGDD